MDVEMRHFLVAVRADVGEQAISGFNQPGFARDLAHRADETDDFLCTGPRCIGPDPANRSSDRLGRVVRLR